MIPVLIGLAEIVVLMGVFFMLGVMGWPGADDD